MNTITVSRQIINSYRLLITLIIASLVSACGLNPQNVDLDINTTVPEVKTTIFNQAIKQLGDANVLYGRSPLYVMSKPIFDNTGTSLPTQGEVPQDISEMVKSTLNAFGGGIFYVPYDPEFMLNTAQTGYTTWPDKLLPNVVLVGGLTEFDRGLVTKEEGADISGSAEEIGIPMGFDGEDTRKTSLARITLDFNLLDFNTFTGIPFIQAVNTMSVHKGLGIDQIGFTLYGQTFGLRGNIKKIQGRHAAVRLLVQSSIIQVIGKQQKLPYWRLLPNAKPDSVVLDAIREEFYGLELPDRIAKIQQYLYLCGENIEITGRLDAKTHSAINRFRAEHKIESHELVSEEIYLALFNNVPLDIQAKLRSKKVIVMLEKYQNNLRDLAIQQSENMTTISVKTFKPKLETIKPQLGEVNVWMDKQAFQIGEQIAIFFEVTQPMFVRIVTIDSGGKISTLFPNAHQNDNFVYPGKTYQIPPTGSSVNLIAGAPAGVDKIRVAASIDPISTDKFPFDANGEFISNATQQFAIADMEFRVLAKPTSHISINEGDKE